MGIFSSKKETVVGTSVSRLLKDNQVPDAIKTAMMESIYNGTDLVDSILEAATTSFGSKTEKMYRYANKGTVYGMPSGEIYSSSHGYSQAKDVLADIEGSEVSVTYIRFGGVNLLHMAWMDLVEQYGYNPATNQITGLSAQAGSLVYLVDMYLELPSVSVDNFELTELEVLGASANSGYTPVRAAINPYYAKPTQAVLVNVLANPRVVVKHGRMVGTGASAVFVESTMYMPIRDLDYTGDYYHVKYQVGAVTKYWAYKQGTGTYPVLDGAFTNSPNVIGDFFPNIYYRLNKQNLGAEGESARFLASNGLSKKLGIPFESINNSIHDNPDIGDVEQAFLTLGVPADSNDKGDLEYLFDFFDGLYMASPTQEGEYQFGYEIATGDESVFSGNPRTIRIADNVFEMNLVYDSIHKSRKVGVLGPVGTVTRDIQAVRKFLGRNVNYRYYRRQISLNLYEEILIVGLVMRYTISGGNMTTLGDDGTSEVLLIPMDRSLIKTYSVRDQERLYARSLHIVCNSLVVVKIAWYAQSWFTTLIQVAAIVWTIITLGTDGGTFYALATTLATMSYSQLVMVILKEILIYYIIQQAIKIFVKLVGVEIAFIAAIVAAAYGVGQASANGAQAVTQVGLTAQSLIQLASGIASAVSQRVNVMTNDLVNQASNFEKEKEEKLELLESVSKELESNSILKPFVILGESPQTTYKRTVHSGNIGALVFDDIHHYVARSLQLPTFSATLGGISYGI